MQWPLGVRGGGVTWRGARPARKSKAAGSSGVSSSRRLGCRSPSLQAREAQDDEGKGSIQA